MIIYMNMEGIYETGPTVYRLYPRRLESLTICGFYLQRQHFLLSYFKTLSVGPAGVELTTSCVTARCSANETPVRGAMIKPKISHPMSSVAKRWLILFSLDFKCSAHFNGFIFAVLNCVPTEKIS